METPSNVATLPFGPEVSSEVAGLLARQGLELCHIGWRQGRSRGVLTLTIDRVGGVTLDDCEKATHAVESFLDAVEALSSPFVLEVESPGLDRRLWTVDQCGRFIGRRVRVRLAQRIEGAANLKGSLESVDDDAITILDEDQRRRYTVRFVDVMLARLVDDETGGTSRTPGRLAGQRQLSQQGNQGNQGNQGRQGQGRTPKSRAAANDNRERSTT